MRERRPSRGARRGSRWQAQVRKHFGSCHYALPAPSVDPDLEHRSVPYSRSTLIRLREDAPQSTKPIDPGRTRYTFRLSHPRPAHRGQPSAVESQRRPQSNSLSLEIRRIANSDECRPVLERNGRAANQTTPTETGERVKRDYAYCSALVKQLGIKPG